MDLKRIHSSGFQVLLWAPPTIEEGRAVFICYATGTMIKAGSMSQKGIQKNVAFPRHWPGKHVTLTSAERGGPHIQSIERGHLVVIVQREIRDKPVPSPDHHRHAATLFALARLLVLQSPSRIRFPRRQPCGGRSSMVSNHPPFPLTSGQEIECTRRLGEYPGQRCVVN